MEINGKDLQFSSFGEVIVNKQAQAVKLNWARARRLAELADISPAVARNFLVGVEEVSILDGEMDKRNSAIREMVTAAQAHSFHHSFVRPTNGNKPVVEEELNPESARRWPRSYDPRLRATDPEIKPKLSIALLSNLLDFADTHGGLKQMIELLPKLQKLTLEYGGFDNIIAGCKLLDQFDSITALDE